MTNHNQINDLQIKINRLNAKKASLQTKFCKVDTAKRRKRTRTLIQMGGMINMLGLDSVCEVSLGEDLQTEAMDKAAVLLGLLMSLQETLPHSLSPSEIEKYKNKGLKMLKQSTKYQNA
jgi:hypothetical protein